MTWAARRAYQLSASADGLNQSCGVAREDRLDLVGIEAHPTCRPPHRAELLVECEAHPRFSSRSFGLARAVVGTIRPTNASSWSPKAAGKPLLADAVPRRTSSPARQSRGSMYPTLLGRAAFLSPAMLVLHSQAARVSRHPTFDRCKLARTSSIVNPSPPPAYAPESRPTKTPEKSPCRKTPSPRLPADLLLILWPKKLLDQSRRIDHAQTTVVDTRSCPFPQPDPTAFAALLRSSLAIWLMIRFSGRSAEAIAVPFRRHVPTVRASYEVRGYPETGTGSRMLCLGGGNDTRGRVPVPVSE